MPNFSQLIKRQKPTLGRRPNVYIGLPIYDHIEAETAQSLFNMLFSTDAGFQINFRTGTLIDRARSGIMQKFLEMKELDYLLFVDGDMVFPSDALTRLLGHGKDIVTAFATTRHFKNVIPVIGRFKYDEEGNLSGVQTRLTYPEDTLFEIESCGMALTLISRRAAEAAAGIDPGRGLFQQIPLKNGGTLPEDSSFCWRAKQAGITAYCDSSLSIGHKGSYLYTELDYKAQFQEPLTKKHGDFLP